MLSAVRHTFSPALAYSYIGEEKPSMTEEQSLIERSCGEGKARKYIYGRGSTGGGTIDVKVKTVKGNITNRNRAQSSSGSTPELKP
jgi:hypothetical protein